jgi:hypothetical protein
VKGFEDDFETGRETGFDDDFGTGLFVGLVVG